MKETEQKTPLVRPEDKVPIKEKLAYGAGGTGVGIQEYADNALLTPIFVIGMGISPITMSICGMVYRAYDAISDATMGWVTDNTRTRWGRRRPYLFLGAILMAIVMPMMFMFNPTWDLIYITAWMICFQILLTTTQTIYNIPYQCLLIEMTPDSNERTSLSAWRSYFGQVVGLIAGWTWWLSLNPFFQQGNTGKPDPLLGAPWVIGGLALVACILGLMPPIFNRERYYEKTKNQKSLSIINATKSTFTSKSFMLILAFILTGVVGASMTGSMGFYVRLYYVCGADQVLCSSIVGAESIIRIFITIVSIRLFQALSVRWGKRETLFLVASVLMTGNLSTFILYTPSMPYLSIVPTLFWAAGQGALWVLVMSMIGDIVEEDELNSGTRKEGSFSAVFSWTQKLTFTLTSGLSGTLVVLAGFDVDNREALTEQATTNMRVMFALVPVILMSIALIFLFFYPLTTSRIQEIRQTLEERRGTVTD